MLAIKSENRLELIAYLRMMLLIRSFEERSAEQYTLGKIRGFLHLYIGEEAIAVGSINTLQPQDYIVTHYRDHGHALARGLHPNAIMAELFGKVTGCSKGKGGSMHLFDASQNFMGGYAIVGGQLPIAVGLALAAKHKATDQVVLCFFGDGAVNEGEFHESMNLASLWKLPMIFFLENNLYGMGSHIERTHAGGRDVYRVAQHYAMPAQQIDGMDILNVHHTTQEVVEWVRQGNGPYFLEALTYRFGGHSMADPIQYRDKLEGKPWESRDPIESFRQVLLEEGLLSLPEIDDLKNDVAVQIEDAIRFADESPLPDPKDLEADVYLQI